MKSIKSATCKLRAIERYLMQTPVYFVLVLFLREKKYKVHQIRLNWFNLFLYLTTIQFFFGHVCLDEANQLRYNNHNNNQLSPTNQLR